MGKNAFSLRACPILSLELLLLHQFLPIIVAVHFISSNPKSLQLSFHNRAKFISMIEDKETGIDPPTPLTRSGIGVLREAVTTQIRLSYS